jgi:hypothetical protein
VRPRRLLKPKRAKRRMPSPGPKKAHGTGRGQKPLLRVDKEKNYALNIGCTN